MELESVVFNVPFYAKHTFGRKLVAVLIKFLDILCVRLCGCGFDNFFTVRRELVKSEAAFQAHLSAVPDQFNGFWVCRD